MDYKNYYTALGQLVYAIAMADGCIQNEEVNKIFNFVISHLVELEQASGNGNEALLSFNTEKEFHRLWNKNESIKAAYQKFIDFVDEAALTADKVAEFADFFSFGTNDLTQMTFGYSRDDVGSFLPQYVEDGILEEDPFAVLDQTGVGQLVETGTRLGRTTKKDLKVGICGEHGGEPKSVEFCYRTGLNYVSCSPYRVPIARLAAAQAVITNR